MLSKRRWPEETEVLRGILAEFPLTEETKWGKPCFLFEGKNVVLIQGFNAYIALMFFKGALLKGAKKQLATPGDHQSARQLRFTDSEEILAKQAVVKASVAEAIAIEKAGLKVQLKAKGDFVLPEELERKFGEMAGLKKAYFALTPGRQRYYVLHIAGAKQAKTREARVEACVPRILQGLGMMDRG